MQTLTSNKKNVATTTVLLMLVLIIATIQVTDAVSWSTYENRLTTNLNFDGLPVITQTSDGKIWILWQKEQFDNDTVAYITSSDFGLSWSSEKPLVVSAGQNTHPSMRQAINGTIWLVWSSDRTGYYEIFYRTSSDLGSSWSEDIQLTNNPYFDLSPSIVTATNGSIWVFWSTNRLGNYEIFYKVYNGTMWSDDVQLTNDSAADKTPSAIQTKDGRIWVAWCTSRYGGFEIFYKIHNGTMWSGNRRLTNDPKIDMVPSLLETVDGFIWIFWASSPPATTYTDDIYYKYSANKGLTWSSADQFTTDKYDDTWPAVYQTSNTRIWVLWASDRADQPDWGNYDVWYRTSLVGDINNDGDVDITDLATVAQAFGTKPGDLYWNPDADLNKDDKVDIDDLILVGRNYGST